MLAPEYSQGTLAPQLILIKDKSKLTCYLYGWLSAESKSNSDIYLPKIWIHACIIRKKNLKDYVSSFYLQHHTYKS